LAKHHLSVTLPIDNKPITGIKTHLPRLSKISGMRKFRSDQSSAMLFCSGVPVNSKRCAHLYCFSSLYR